MTALEIIRSMTEEQARKISQSIHQTKIGNTEAAHTIMEGMDADTLDLLIAYIEAAQKERHKK